ncbi:MAG: bi-domain-containing oxidoreductase [Bacteroidota bacterium]|nr:bi-domain-containing oxidoreductase [Candidatus Kapabacteria bacterium]MDW8220132.1 bi-domain-containing oxidoreductase [Bacteroidota bacterium]
MLQVLQHQSTGTILVEEVPVPSCPPNGVIVRVSYSLISTGTERTSVSNAQSSLLERAWKQPQDVKKILDGVRTDGLLPTFRKVRNKLDAYKALGYSAAGVVVESRCTEFAPGDRVACAGNTYAYHAELIAVPKHLVVRIPAHVPDKEACYTTLGAIAMQGIRQAHVQLGMYVAVIGLGLIGQLTVQLLKAAGCRVVGLDINSSLFPIAQALGADLTVQSNRSAYTTIQAFSNGFGVDAVIITASTESDEPVQLALEIVRKRGTVVVVGDVGMNIPRSPFYEKEVQFTIACSYGAGRYDPTYEEQGIDYPIGYVRWTENRNMQAFVDMLAAGKVDVRTMTTHCFPVEHAASAYALVTGSTQEPHLGIVLEYSAERNPLNTPAILPCRSPQRSTLSAQHTIGIGVVGAGGFAQTHLLPHFQRYSHVQLIAVATTSPITAKSVAERFGFAGFSTDGSAVIADERTSFIVCASRHDSHARYVLEALQHKKRIFVEKPLCVSPEELSQIDAALEVSQHYDSIMVGFNRRFSSAFAILREFFASRQDPMSIVYRVNAGAIPRTSWIHERTQGGRIVGECCHFIDCMVFLTHALPVRVFAQSIATSNLQAAQHDTVSITITFSDGSLGTLHYFANGDSSIPKEYCEVFCEGAVAQMTNFTSLILTRSGRTKKHRLNGTKGHREEIQATLESVRLGNPFPIDYTTIRAVTAATFAAEQSLAQGTPVHVSVYT